MDSAGTTYGATVCGTRLYEIIDIATSAATAVATVETVSSGNYRIRAYSTDENLEGTHNLRLKVTFVDYPLSANAAYPVSETYFTLLINQATCDCALITWDNPAQLTLSTGLMTSPPDTVTFTKATANEASKSASPAIRACYRNGASCPTSSSIAIVDDDTGALDAAFMSITSNTLTVEPTVSSQIKSYNMRVTQTTSITSDFSWIGAVVTVTCTITTINVPTVPTETTYLIGSGDLVLTLTPNFLQYPPCDYTLTEFMIWESTPTPNPAVQNVANAYETTINTSDLSKA